MGLDDEGKTTKTGEQKDSTDKYEKRSILDAIGSNRGYKSAVTEEKEDKAEKTLEIFKREPRTTDMWDSL